MTTIDLGIPLAYRDWTLKAACRGADVDLFFSPDGEKGKARRARETAAKAVCRPCPARAQCLAYSLATETSSTRHGVWAAMTPDERAGLTKGARA